jgi:hypothetical protein
MLLHLVYRAVPMLFPTLFADLLAKVDLSDEPVSLLRWIISAACAVLAVVVLVGISWLSQNSSNQSDAEDSPSHDAGDALLLATQSPP